MTDTSLMPFGKYRGNKLANVPANYLIWLYDNNKVGGELKKYIEDNRALLDLEATPNPVIETKYKK